MRPKSDTLFHFTKSPQILQDILLHGFWPRYCLEDVKWYVGQDHQLAYPMVCFCDIPLSRVDEHVQFYGNYGIGVTREWAQKNRLSPAIYLSENTELHHVLNRILRQNLEKNGLYENSNGDMNFLLSMIKPMTGIININGAPVLKEFYQESEWRYVIDSRNHQVMPWMDTTLFYNQTALHTNNQKTKEAHSLKLMPGDIKYIFLKEDWEIPNLINFIQTHLGHFSHTDLQILMSRIISLDTISRDI